MSQSPGEGEALAEGTLISHLLELRDRLLRSVIALAICFTPLAFFQNELFTLVAKPLIDKLPAGTSLIATSVVSPFMAPLKLTLILALFLAMPYILSQIWGFVAPGLYKHERRFALPLIVSSVLLFYGGIAFAYYIVFPLMFKFLAATMKMPSSTYPRFLRRVSRRTRPVETSSTVATGTWNAIPNAKKSSSTKSM